VVERGYYTEKPARRQENLTTKIDFSGGEFGSGFFHAPTRRVPGGQKNQRKFLGKRPEAEVGRSGLKIDISFLGA
jgi:hypothetical protein